MNKLLILMYHYVRPIKNSKFPGLKGLELNKFESQLNYLVKNYNIIKYDDLVNYILFKKKLKKKPCLLTFDDGYKDHAKYVLPKLKKKGLFGCFFPIVSAVEKQKLLNVNKVQFILAKKNPSNLFYEIINYLTKKCNFSISSINKIIKIKKKFVNKNRFDNKETTFIKYLLNIYLPKNISQSCCNYLFKKYVSFNEKNFSKQLYLSKSDIKKLINHKMYVGGHGYDHLHLDKVGKSKQQNEIKKTVKFLKKISSLSNNWAMCYPFGSFNNTTKKILKKNNCLVGFTTKKGFVNLSKCDFLELKRLDTNEVPIK